MERGDSHVATVAKSTEAARFNTASLWEAGTLPSRSNDAWSRGADTATNHLPGLMLTNGDQVIADAPKQYKPFQLGATNIDYAANADRQGAVPFGPMLKGSASDGKSASHSYYSATLGFKGHGANGIVHEQAVNVNIGDGMTLNGKPLADGLPHRGVFPIVPEKDAISTHWNWVDATVTIKDGRGDVAIHRISPSEQKPTKDSEWDDINLHWALRHQQQPQHLSCEEYWTQNSGESYNAAALSESYRNGLKYVRVEVREKAK
jgi:hypothetical protein